MITIEISDNSILAHLTKLAASVSDPKPALHEIGQLLVDSTRQRFATSTAPDGSRWASNSQVTILRYLAAKSGNFSKGKRVGTKDGYFYKKGENKGRLASKGIDVVSSKRPLLGETGSLSSQISYEIDGSGNLFIGSPMIYAAAQQFGASKHQFKGKAPWGDIPARPFLGISSQDSQNILAIISDYLQRSMSP